MVQHAYDAIPVKLLLQSKTVKAYAFGNPDPLTMYTLFLVHFVFKDRSVTSLMYIMTNDTDKLINYTTASALEMIQMVQPSRLNQLLQSHRDHIQRNRKVEMTARSSTTHTFLSMSESWWKRN